MYARPPISVVPRIHQNKAGHSMVFTQCSILNYCSPDVDENRSSFVKQSFI